MLIIESRKAEISALVGNLSARFNERVFLRWAKRHPEEAESFWQLWDEFDQVLWQYLTVDAFDYGNVKEKARDVFCFIPA